MEIKGSKTSGSLSKDGGIAFFVLMFNFFFFLNLEILRVEQHPGKHFACSGVAFPNCHFLCPGISSKKKKKKA